MVGKEISTINEKIQSGSVAVYTEQEILDSIEKEESLGLSDVDIITVAFRSSISGSAIMMLIPVTGRGVFTRAEKIWLNGIPGFPGPAPNERLGMVDTLIFVDQPPIDEESHYDGLRLFRDIIENSEITVRCLSIEGDYYDSSCTLDTLQFARMYVYNFFLTPLPAQDTVTDHNTDEIFNMMRCGARVILNKAQGIIVGSGTRSSNVRRSLSITADIFDMDPDSISEMNMERGRELSNSIAVAIPVLDAATLQRVTSWIRGRKDGARKTDMADCLKALIVRKEFYLTESDMLL